MSGGYTYTTLSAHHGEPVRIGVSFYLDTHACITVPGIGSGHPHLSITHGDVQVAVSPASPDKVTDDDARIARSLADSAAMYAAEIERLLAASEASRPGTAVV